jgi:hypothetical protein
MGFPTRFEDVTVMPGAQFDAIPIDGGDTRIDQPDTGALHFFEQVQLVLHAVLAVSFAALR